MSEPSLSEPSLSEATPLAPLSQSTTARSKPQFSLMARFREYVVLIGIAMGLAIVIRLFIGLAFEIPTESMVPTLMPNDRVVVSRLSYRFGEPNRGDISVFENPGYIAVEESAPRRLLRTAGSLVGVGQPREKYYIKRIIGLPGDTVEGKDGKVYVNGVVLNEPWLTEAAGSKSFGLERVPAGKYWVLGDNRQNSCDSTCFPDKTGKPAKFVDRSAIVGPAVFRVWPPSRIGKP
jgi:signal peptidase I